MQHFGGHLIQGQAGELSSRFWKSRKEAGQSWNIIEQKKWENIPEIYKEISKRLVNASACHIRLRLLGGSVSLCQPYGNYRWKLTSNCRPRATIWSERPPVLITLNRGCSAPSLPPSRLSSHPAREARASQINERRSKEAPGTSSILQFSSLGLYL